MTTRLSGRAGAAALRVQRVALEVLEGPDAGERVRCGGERITVGSAEGNTLRLSDRSVSRHHFEIVADQDGFLLRDLGSTNGTWVGDLRAREVFLRPGVVLEAGESKIRFEPLAEEEELALAEEERFYDLVGRSAAMRRLFATLAQVAPRDVSVLITGESGTGKELVARALHQASPRRSRPCVVIDCGAMPPGLMESELFGFERGAFTGADRSSPGAFERAQSGTVFLDEIGELPLDLQPKLLRVLDSRQVARLGGGTPKKVDFRLVAATNRDLREAVNRGTFRADLFFRLSVVELRLPPLRERPEDIPLLVRHFIEDLTANDAGAAGYRLSTATMDRLKRHFWPGNVRELRNFVERTLAITEGQLLSAVPSGFGQAPPEHLEPAAPPPVPGRAPAPARMAGDAPGRGAAGIEEARRAGIFDLPYKRAKRAYGEPFEKAYLAALLERAGNNVSEAARLGEVDRAYLLQLLRKHDLR